MEDTTQHHQFDPSDIPIIPMEDGPPKYDPDPSLAEIVAERGFKSDSEMIRRHREQNRPFRSVSPMDFTSNPLCNNQEFARSGQIEPGNIYDVKLHLVQFSSDPTYDSSVRKGSPPRSVKDPDDFLLMDQTPIEPDHQILQPPIYPHQPQDQAGNAHRPADSSGILGQAAEKCDPAAHRLAEGHDIEGYDPPSHDHAEPIPDQNHYVNSNHSFARHSTPGLTIDASKLNRSDNAGAIHYNGQFESRDISSGPYVVQIPIPHQGQSVQGQHGPFVRKDMSPYPHKDAQGQLDPQPGLNPEHDAHGATHVRDQWPNPVGQDHWGHSVGSRRHLTILGELTPLEQPTGPDLGSGQTTGPDRKLSAQGGQDRLGQPTGQDFVSGQSAKSRARPYKKGSRAKRPKPMTNDPNEMPVKQFIQGGFSTMPPLQLEALGFAPRQSQQAHQPQDQFQYSPESELWTQPSLQQGDEQHAPYGGQIPFKQDSEDPQFAGQQELLYQDQLMQLPQGAEHQAPYWDQIPHKQGSWDPQLAEQQALHQFQLQINHDLEQWTQPCQQQLPQGDEQFALHRDQVPYLEDLWDSQHARQQAPYQLQADQDQILYNPESCDQPNPQYIPPSTGNGYTVPVHYSSNPHNFPIPQGINYAAAGRTSENYEVLPDHIPITAQPLDEGCADISNSPELDLYDLDAWKQDVQNDQCRAPVNIIPQPSSQRTSISEYTNDTTSSSAQSSPSLPRRSSVKEAFKRAQEAILSDGLDEMEDLHDATIGTYADFARSIDLQLPVHVPCVPAARESSPTSESSFDGYSPPPQSRISLKARRNRENPRLKRTAEQKRDRKREQNRKDSKKSVARKQSRREEAEKQSEYIKNSVKKQKGANLEFENNMEDLLAGHNSYLLNEKQEYIGWKGEVRRILDDQRNKDVKEAFEKKQAAKEKFEKFACEYKTIRDKSRKSTVGSQKCRASQDAQLLESEYQILLYSHDLRREKQLKALAELYFTRTIPFYMQQCQPTIDKRLQDFITDNQHLLQN